MSGLDRLLVGNAEAIEALPIEKRAMISGGLPDELSIKDIATLAYPDDSIKQEALIKVLVNSCKVGELQYYGDIGGWSYREDMPNPFPKIKGDYFTYQIWDGRPQMLYAYSCDCLIHKDNFKPYLQNKKQWPVNELLAKWWKGSEPQAEGTKNVAGIVLTPPCNRKSQEELDELRRLRMERENESSKKRNEKLYDDMQAHSQFFKNQMQRNEDRQKEIAKQAYLDALREYEAEKPINKAQPQAGEVGNIGALGVLAVVDGTKNQSTESAIYLRRKTEFELLNTDPSLSLNDVFSLVIKTENKVWHNQRQTKGATPEFINKDSFDSEFYKDYCKEKKITRKKGAPPKPK